MVCYFNVHLISKTIHIMRTWVCFFMCELQSSSVLMMTYVFVIVIVCMDVLWIWIYEMWICMLVFNKIGSQAMCWCGCGFNVLFIRMHCVRCRLWGCKVANNFMKGYEWNQVLDHGYQYNIHCCHSERVIVSMNGFNTQCISFCKTCSLAAPFFIMLHSLPFVYLYISDCYKFLLQSILSCWMRMIYVWGVFTCVKNIYSFPDETIF